jgi:restriction endonuclease
VIIDEPQSVDSTDKAQEAIKALNTLCTLRYSATHRNPYNLVYRLDPVRAFELKRVANYRDYDGSGQPVKGKFAELFEAELAALAKDERYRELEWLKQPMDKLHNGYFAQDKKGVLKDTRGDTQADDEVYNLIMKEKERLLSMDELMGGQDSRTVQELSGHKNITMTVRYSHLSSTHRAKAIAILDRIPEPAPAPA